MKDKTDEKKINHININTRKREKFIKPLITDDDLKDEQDVYFSVVKNKPSAAVKPKTEKPHNPNNSFVYISPMRGKVQDKSTFPVTSSGPKIGKQYDFLRQDKKLTPDELKKKYGHPYYEFKFVNNNPAAKEAADKSDEKPKPLKQEEEINFDDLPIFKDRKVKKEDIGIIYEEDLEIELDETEKVMTSYDENSNLAKPFDLKQTDIKTDYPKITPKVDIYEHKIERRPFRADIKQLFEDINNPEEEDVFFREEVEIDDSEEEPAAEKSENPARFDFVNLKEELDKDLKSSNVKKKQVTQEKEETVDDYLDYYNLPPMDLLYEGDTKVADESEWIRKQMDILDATLESFGIAAKTVSYTMGPAVTRFEIEPEPGIKVSKITALQDDIKLRLAASDIRMEAPISGKSTVGVEVPNEEKRLVRLREILDSPKYRNFRSPLKVALGLDIAGEPVYSDISTMTHTLIAGSTGSGKSICISTIIMSILYNAMPDEVKLVLIDPKKVEFSMFRDIPHLLTPVVNDPKVATATLKWITEEMDRRYGIIENGGAKDIKSYNQKRSRSDEKLEPLPYIVVIIDELADLMLIAAAEVEEYFQRISQLARAAGIHLIVATQRPSTNVITGTIKTNIPSRIAFRVSSAIDSRIILDEGGAEKLLGKGDMLYIENGKPFSRRLQGPFISDEEIERITHYVKSQSVPQYLFTADDLLQHDADEEGDYDDELFDEVARFIISAGEASTSKIQRRFKVGYNRAARLVEMLESKDIIGPQQGGSKPREVLMTLDEYEDYKNYK